MLDDALLTELQQRSPLQLPPPLWARLAEHYASPGRAYHTLEHVVEVVRHCQGLPFARPREVFLAVLYHDAIYEVGQRDNEQKSAELAERELSALQAQPALELGFVRELILLTARHGHVQPTEVDADTALFLDCDIAILGAEPAAFARYESQIATEYVPRVGEMVYRAGRRMFLQGLLQRPRIFLSEHFHAQLDERARRNLASASDGASQ
jgi:predicted metal-dependent HD superfamily phosphohydrolase